MVSRGSHDENNPANSVQTLCICCPCTGEAKCLLWSGSAWGQSSLTGKGSWESGEGPSGHHSPTRPKVLLLTRETSALGDWVHRGSSMGMRTLQEDHMCLQGQPHALSRQTAPGWRAEHSCLAGFRTSSSPPVSRGFCCDAQDSAQAPTSEQPREPPAPRFTFGLEAPKGCGLSGRSGAQALG